ncbi:MAG: FecR family protein [Methylococcales bacterium]
MSLNAEADSIHSTLGKTQDQALAWFARLQDSNVNQADKDAFADWLAASASNQIAYDKVIKLWQSPALNTALSRYAAIPLQPALPKRHPQYWAAAACVVLMSAWISIASGWVDRWQADVATGTGEQRRELLADGSTLILNTDSAVKIDINGNHRGVKLLSGEVYFEVQPDKTWPFIVATAQGTVRVVGTRFTVKAEETTQVDVESGIVACTSEQGESRQLIAGQHTSIASQSVATITQIDPSRAFAWLKGRLIFQDQPLAEVIAELDRYLPGAILIADAKLGQTRITGNYKLEDTAAIVRSLADIAGARVINLSPYLTILKS